jgi:hypothetical protein
MMFNYVMSTIFLLFGSQFQQQVQFTFVPSMSKSDTVQWKEKPYIWHRNFFLVSGNSDSTIISKAIDSFSLRNGSPEAVKYGTLTLEFFKETDRTNLKNINENPRKFFKFYSEIDRIAQVIYTNGRFSLRMNYKDGLFIGKNNIEIKRLNE